MSAIPYIPPVTKENGMARLDIGIGEEFPVEERRRDERSGEDCARRHAHAHHHHHHGSWRERWRHHFSRDKDTLKKDKE